MKKYGKTSGGEKRSGVGAGLRRGGRIAQRDP